MYMRSLYSFPLKSQRRYYAKGTVLATSTAVCTGCLGKARCSPEGKGRVVPGMRYNACYDDIGVRVLQHLLVKSFLTEESPQPHEHSQYSCRNTLCISQNKRVDYLSWVVWDVRWVARSLHLKNRIMDVLSYPYGATLRLVKATDDGQPTQTYLYLLEVGSLRCV